MVIRRMQQDGWQSGLMRTPGKRVCCKAPGVRIPPHPPGAMAFNQIKELAGTEGFNLQMASFSG